MQESKLQLRSSEMRKSASILKLHEKQSAYSKSKLKSPREEKELVINSSEEFPRFNENLE